MVEGRPGLEDAEEGLVYGFGRLLDAAAGLEVRGGTAAGWPVMLLPDWPVRNGSSLD